MKKKANQKSVSPKYQKTAQSKYRNEFWLIASLIIFSGLIYSNILGNDFINNWDDNVYILKNNLIKFWDWEHIKAIFSTFYGGNYHPLITLSNAVEYRLFGEDPMPYHLFNLLFHLLNVLLVYIFIRNLTQKFWIAFITAAFFSVHPLRVESVAWIAERKDVLYSFFFLLGLIAYVKSIKTTNIKNIFLTYLFFILSLLSKSAAVCFPLVLVLIDFYKDRKIVFKKILYKTPLFLLSLLFGIIALYSQKSSEAMADLTSVYSIFERIFLVSYSTVYYILSAVIPFNLSAIHYYPFNNDGLPLIYYLSFIFLALLIIPLIRKNEFLHEYRFGVFFYISTVFLVLQIIPVGQAIVAERYSYLPHVGLFFIIGSIFEFYHTNKNKYKQIYKMLGAGIIALFIVFSWLTQQRNNVWKNGNTLFSDVIEKYPEHGHAYWVRGNFFNETGQYKTALEDFDKGVALQCKEPGLYMSRGYAKHFLGKYAEAIQNYNIAIEMKTKYPEALYNRGISYMKTDSLEKSFSDFSKAVELKPDYHEAWFNRGNVNDKLGKTKEAIEDYDKGISIFPHDAMAYFNRGISKMKLKEHPKAIEDFNIALSYQPNNPDIYLNRAIAKDGLKDYNGALQDNNTVLKYQPTNPLALFNRGISKFYLNDKKGACEDWDAAMKNGHPQAGIILQEYCGR